jgi:hypothetical protein
MAVGDLASSVRTRSMHRKHKMRKKDNLVSSVTTLCQMSKAGFVAEGETPKKIDIFKP